MTYVILSNCIDVTDRSCVEECPVDCIYVGDRKAYINPKECIDCGACELACPVEAIVQDKRVETDRSMFAVDNTTFFEVPLPGRNSPVGTPGGSLKVGEIGLDTELVAAYEAS